MTWLEALILGLIQGLTEFIPVSSSGHLELGKALLGVEFEDELTFSILVHFATVLSTILVFRKEIFEIIKQFFKFKLNEETHFVLKIIVSMFPILIVGLFFKEFVESFFSGRIIFVGFMLLITASLLTFAYFYKPKEKKLSYKHAFIIGIAQAIAVLPGISRAGATIATGLLLGNKRDVVAKFSFLMILIPIIGANFFEMRELSSGATTSIGSMPLIVGFFAAFLSGLFACRWMIVQIKKGKIIYFAIYCFIVGSIAILSGLF